MSPYPKPLHYEDLPGRGPSMRFRVGDANDNFVRDFRTEEEARTFVRRANAQAILDAAPSWRY